MGYKLHVAEEYQVRHNSSDAFSNRSAEINRMLHENCPDLTWMGEDVECSEQLKVPRSDRLPDGWSESVKFIPEE